MSETPGPVSKVASPKAGNNYDTAGRDPKEGGSPRKETIEISKKKATP